MYVAYLNLGVLLALDDLSTGPLGEINTLVGLALWLGGELGNLLGALTLELVKSEGLWTLWLNWSSLDSWSLGGWGSLSTLSWRSLNSCSTLLWLLQECEQQVGNV